MFGDKLESIYGEDKLALLMSSYWINFATTGNPNGESSTPTSPVWPSYVVGDDTLLRFDVEAAFGGDGTHVQSQLRKQACDWQTKNRVPLSRL